MSVTAFEAANDVLDRADALLLLDSAPQLDDVRTDIRRLAWAMGVAAIDTYLHWLVRKVDLYASLPKSLEKLEVPFKDLVAMSHEGVSARKAGLKDRPITRVRNVLHDRILKETFQSARGVETALELAGLKGFWRDLSAELGEPVPAIKTHLNQLAHRRNAVVHEGDIKRMSRPRAIKRNELNPTDARNELDWVRAFIVALGVVAPST